MDKLLEQSKQATSFVYEDLTSPAAVQDLSSEECSGSPAKITVTNMDAADINVKQPSTPELTPTPQASFDHQAVNKLSQLNDFKFFPSVEIQATAEKSVLATVPLSVPVSASPLQSNAASFTNGRMKSERLKHTIVKERNFLVRVVIKEDRPGHPKSRTYLTFESFNLHMTKYQQLTDLIRDSVDDNNMNKFGNQKQKLASCLGLDYCLPDFFRPKPPASTT